MRLWVDTDFGFDDLWALLLLRVHGLQPAGVSLVAGNAPLPQVTRNALGAARAFGGFGPLFAGADRPLRRPAEHAARILGPRGMQSRGAHLPEPDSAAPLPAAADGLARFLDAGDDEPATILALGPLTNLAALAHSRPAQYARIGRIVWMGGSAGRGNHTPAAEFNALADPEAADRIARGPVPLAVVDLQACRQATFGPEDLPGLSSPLLSDLLGGYLDIALSRGRTRMAIYDPIAALALVMPAMVAFAPAQMRIELADGPDCGRTAFAPDRHGPHRLATRVAPDAARHCLDALKKVQDHA
ncbi:nucleoside hydrolase [Rhodobacteraceae bacterium 2CG4]|uniref:Nucleoside hydrolase n=1 Tax=Halovulum marinum TaxID=2662447 RepID=A0A6L5Z0H4_9RHOB|nr:nucleoside hydrolase [Halovulum marinum]MSU90053.1 nucleoside hydrolase [Halovulum marinum]